MKRILKDKQHTGKLGESLVKLLLKHQGHQHTASRFRCYLGEMDLIMSNQQKLYFIEVRMKRNTRFGRAEESITIKKRRTLKNIINIYLQKNPQFTSCEVSLMLIAIHWHPQQSKYTFRRVPIF